MSGWTIYLVLMLDKIEGVCIGSCVACTIIFCILGTIFLHMAPVTTEHEKRIGASTKRIFKYTLPVFIFSILCACFIPNTKQALMIWGIPKVVNNEHIQRGADNSLKLLDTYLQKQLEEMQKELAPQEVAK